MQNRVLKCILCTLAIMAAGMSSVEAQRSERAEPLVPLYRIPGTAPEPDRSTRQSGLTERTFNILTGIHDDFGEQRFESARERLIALQERGRLTDYERALISQNLGYVYAVTDNTRQAIDQFTRALAIEAMGHQETQSALLLLGQLYAMSENWDLSIRTLTRYFYWEDNPTPDSLITMATAFAQKDDFRNTLIWVRRAIERARDPRENWYQLWLASHFELREYAEAANVLTQMITMWPDKPIYWEQLAGVFQQLERDNESLAVLAMSYQRGLITDGAKLLNLVRFYQYRGAPYSAARILQKGMDDGLIEPTRSNLELLATTYQASEERVNAIRALQRAAALSDDGELYVREAQLHAMIDDWENVQRAARDALDKGGLRNPGRAWMMLGIAAYEDKNYQEALRGFRQATQHAETRQRADQWIRYVNNEIRVNRLLREGA